MQTCWLKAHLHFPHPQCMYKWVKMFLQTADIQYVMFGHCVFVPQSHCWQQRAISVSAGLCMMKKLMVAKIQPGPLPRHVWAECRVKRALPAGLHSVSHSKLGWFAYLSILAAYKVFELLACKANPRILQFFEDGELHGTRYIGMRYKGQDRLLCHVWICHGIRGTLQP